MFWARLDMNKHSLSTSDCSSDLHLALLFIVYYNSNRSLQWQSFLSVLGCCYVTGQICCQRCLLLFLLELWEDSEWAVLRRSFPWKSAVGTVKCTVNATPFHVLLLMKQKKKKWFLKEMKGILPKALRSKVDVYYFLLSTTGLLLDKCASVRHAAAFLHASFF